MQTLILNRILYDLAKRIFKKIQNNLTIEEQLNCISQLAAFSWRNYDGRLADIELECYLKEISKRIFKSGSQVLPQHKEKTKILHIASTLYGIGGHTRVLINWLEQDKKSEKYVVITNQDDKLNSYIENKIQETNSHLLIFDFNKTVVERAKQLRKYLIDEDFDAVILHIHPNDIIPLLAINYHKSPLTIYYNHADHVFWLGGSFIDLCIDFRETGKEYSLVRRGVYKSKVLPYPLSELTEIDKTKNELKESFGFTNYSTILLTMASSYKLKPIDENNFLALYTDFLKKNTNILLIIIGVTENDFFNYVGHSNIPCNMKLLGNIIEPNCYLKIADYFIESFPYGAGLGLVDCCRYGAIPIFGYTHNVIYVDNTVSMFPKEFRICKTYNKIDYLELLNKEIKTGNIKTSLRYKLADYFKEGEFPNWINKVKLLYKTPKKINFKQHIENYDLTKQDYKAAMFCSQPNKEQFYIISFIWHLKLKYHQRLQVFILVLNTLLQIHKKEYYIQGFNLLKNSKSYFIPNFIKVKSKR